MYPLCVKRDAIILRSNILRSPDFSKSCGIQAAKETRERTTPAHSLTWVTEKDHLLEAGRCWGFTAGDKVKPKHRVKFYTLSKLTLEMLSGNLGVPNSSSLPIKEIWVWGKFFVPAEKKMIFLIVALIWHPHSFVLQVKPYARCPQDIIERPTL